MPQPAAGDADAASLSALMCSRLCHDLVNPIGALSSGLEVLSDPTMDEAMKEAALDLIRSSAAKSVALLKYARLAYGASGGADAELPLEEAKHVLEGLFAWSKAALDWRLAPGRAPKEEVKGLLVLAAAAADCAPRGGSVVVEGRDGAYEIRVSGQRVIGQEDMLRALKGEADELKPKFAPHYLAAIAARRRGGGIEIAQQEGSLTFRASFRGQSGAIASAALTAG
jgi:histidine phosphotransferase ChpT